MMTHVRMDRSSTERIVGRERELDALLRSADESDGTRLVLLSGDAGVGKTRLLDEALHQLSQRGWQRLVGHCLDFGDSSMPYLPFAEMLSAFGESHPALARLRRRATNEDPEAIDRAEVFEAVLGAVEEVNQAVYTLN